MDIILKDVCFADVLFLQAQITGTLDFNRSHLDRLNDQIKDAETDELRTDLINVLNSVRGDIIKCERILERL